MLLYHKEVIKITKLEIINISIAGIVNLLKNELIDNYPHSIIEFIFKRDKEILLFFGKSILKQLKNLQINDIESKEVELVIHN